MAMLNNQRIYQINTDNKYKWGIGYNDKLEFSYEFYKFIITPMC